MKIILDSLFQKTISKRKYLIVSITILLFIALIVLGFIQSINAPKIIGQEIHITLPSTSKIEHFDLHSWSGDFDAKVLIDNVDIDICCLKT